MTDTLLNDGIIALRAPEPYDIERMYLWENDSEIWSFGNQAAPYSKKNIEDYINGYNADIYSARELRFIIVEVESDTSVGTIDLFDFDPVNLRSAVGILIDSSYRRKGYAARALQLLKQFSVSRLGIHQLWAVVSKENTPSRNLFEKTGFNISGCLRSWIREGRHFSDAYIYQQLFP